MLNSVPWAGFRALSPMSSDTMPDPTAEACSNSPVVQSGLSFHRASMALWSAMKLPLIVFPLLLLCVGDGVAAAQWPRYPTPGVPQSADGKPDLTGPAPKTADGRPDLSGIWQNLSTFPRTDSVSGTGGSPRADGSIPVIMTLF